MRGLARLTGLLAAYAPRAKFPHEASTPRTAFAPQRAGSAWLGVQFSRLVDCLRELVWLVGTDSVSLSRRQHNFDSIQAGNIIEPTVGNQPNPPTIVPAVSYWIGFLNIPDIESFLDYTNTEADFQVIIAYLDGERIEKSHAH